MQLEILRPQAKTESDSEDKLVALARLGGENAIRTLIKRNNRRLFRVARSVMRNDAEAEDIVQATYVKAFTRLTSFRGESQFSTWLTRIALNEAFSRKRRERPEVDITELDQMSQHDGTTFASAPLSLVPLPADSEVMRMEMREALEAITDELPEGFRVVFVLRDIEGLSIEETADLLSLNPGTVKTRLHRAHRLLRTAIESRFSATFADIFPFDGDRCIHMADRVIAQLRG
jgi:RNA polymerase sigma-70 factor (ECF subfamily)